MFGKLSLDNLKDKLRATPLLATGLIFLGLVMLANPAKAWLLLWGLAKASTGGYAAYLGMRFITRDRLHEAKNDAERHSIRMSRTIVVAATVLGLLVGVA